MSLRAKLIVVTLFVGLAPLLVSALTTFRIHQSAFDGALRDGQRQVARQVATTVREIEQGTLRQFDRAAQALPWSQLNDSELRGALNILYQQDDGIAVVALLDRTGESVVESVFLDEPDGSPHPTGSTSLRGRLYETSRDERIPSGNVTVGRPVAGDEQEQVLVPIMVHVTGRGDAPWTILFGWSISSICDAVAQSPQHKTRYVLADGDGTLLCAEREQLALTTLPDEVIGAAKKTNQNEVISYDKDGSSFTAVMARPTGDWLLMVEQPRSVAEAPSRRMFQQSVFWLGAGLIIAISAGLFLAQGISQRVQILRDGADKLAAGNLGHRIEQEGGDELAQLANTFNHMGGQLEKRRKEIEAWNQTLQERVEERTRELESAQKQLLESQKITAVSSLAAGLAHEINNPLTGVLGLTQLLRGRFSRQPEGEKTAKTLGSIEEQALRIREIVQTLQSLSEEESGGRTAVSVRALLEEVVSLADGLVDEKTIGVRVSVAEDVNDVSADPNELRRALMHLVKNAISASEAEEAVSIEASNLSADLVKIVVTDRGVGIAKEHISRVFEPFFTTKKDWGGKGLGLSEAYRIIEQHRGRIELRSEEGEGTTVTVILPIYRKGAHLA